MEPKIKPGWTPKGIVGMVFLPIGLIFCAVGVLVSLYAFEGVEDRQALQIVFLAEGALFALAGAALLTMELRRRRGIRAAYDRGEYVTATVAAVRGIRNVNVNGRYPYEAECHYMDPHTGVLHVYRSRFLYFDPTDLLIGKNVKVYIDPDNEKYYYVDVDSVLPETVMH